MCDDSYLTHDWIILPCAAHPEVSTNGLMRRLHERVHNAIQRKLLSLQ